MFPEGGEERALQAEARLCDQGFVQSVAIGGHDHGPRSAPREDRMMRLRPASMAVVLGLALCGAAAGAAEIKVNYDLQADFTRYKTWRWRKGTPAPDPVADKQLRDAIESRLAARGLSRVESGGDLEVVYHVAAENKIGVENVGYKQLFFEGHATRIRYLSVGTLVLDMIDASSRKVVWRGEAQDATTPAPRAIERMIEEGIAQLLQDFPPEE